jgi:hypothetical protein
MTKDGLRKPNYWGSLTQAATLRIGNYEGEEVRCASALQSSSSSRGSSSSRMDSLNEAALVPVSGYPQTCSFIIEAELWSTVSSVVPF